MGNQTEMFSEENMWEAEWKDMPEFNMVQLVPFKTIKLNFRTEENFKEFCELINQMANIKMENFWYPKLNIKTTSNECYVDEK